MPSYDLSVENKARYDYIKFLNIPVIDNNGEVITKYVVNKFLPFAYDFEDGFGDPDDEDEERAIRKINWLLLYQLNKYTLDVLLHPIQFVVERAK